MKKYKKYIGLVALSFGIMALAAGCGGETRGETGGETDGKPATGESNEPVTVTIAMPSWGLSEATFKKFIADPVKSKYPYIDTQRVVVDIKANKLQEMLAQGVYPDFVMTSSNIMDPLLSVKLTGNIEPLLKANGFDANRLQKGSLDAVRTASGGQYLSALPYTQNYSALYYNKDLFDKFGVAYPKDGMSWTKVVELGRKMTRMDGGTQYYGLHAGKVTRTASQRGLAVVDAKTLKAAVNTEEWKRNFELHKTIFSIPGNTWINEGGAYDRFFKDKTLAMLALNSMHNRFASAPDLNWDMVTYPYVEGKPGIGMGYDLHVMAITADSKHKDAAYKVLATLLSDEVQTTMAQDGMLTVLQNENIRNQFGKNLSYLQGKNLQAIFKTTPADKALPTMFERRYGRGNGLAVTT